MEKTKKKRTRNKNVRVWWAQECQLYLSNYSWHTENSHGELLVDFSNERINEGVDTTATRSERVTDRSIEEKRSSQVIVVDNLLSDTGA